MTNAEKLLIVLVGESGSGKSTIADQLDQEGFPEVISHTSRKPRANELALYRTPYIFSTMEDYEVSEAAGHVFEHTENNGAYYWTCLEDFDFEGVKVVVCDVAGIESLKSRAKDLTLVIIYVESDASFRYSRLMTDYWWQQREPHEYYNREHAEQAVVDRMKRDQGRFDIVPCDYVVSNNQHIDKTMILIHEIITKERGRA